MRRIEKDKMFHFPKNTFFVVTALATEGHQNNSSFI